MQHAVVEALSQHRTRVVVGGTHGLLLPLGGHPTDRVLRVLNDRRHAETQLVSVWFVSGMGVLRLKAQLLSLNASAFLARCYGFLDDFATAVRVGIYVDGR